MHKHRDNDSARVPCYNHLEDAHSKDFAKSQFLHHVSSGMWRIAVGESQLENRSWRIACANSVPMFFAETERIDPDQQLQNCVII